MTVTYSHIVLQFGFLTNCGRSILSACLWALTYSTIATANASNAKPCPANAIAVSVGMSIQRAVDAAPTGAAFCLKNGLHRLQMICPKVGQRFFGEYGAVLDGSRIIDEISQEGHLFVAEVTDVDPWRPHGVCQSTSPNCDVPQNLFINDHALTPVLHKKDVVPGTFHFDRAAGRVFFADDPVNKKVEFAVAPFAFGGTVAAVFISGLTIQKYASVPQQGAIRAHTDWIVEHCEVRQNSAAGISVKAGTRISDCKIHHNGQIGITGSGDTVTIERNEVWANNTRGFDYGWEAGGVKLTLGRGIVMRGNRVYDNGGPGLWCDGDCRGTTYMQNSIQRNKGAGIYHEISYNAIIRDNNLADNGSASEWFWRGQIIVAASEGVNIEHNRLLVGPGLCGIMLIDQGRSDHPNGVTAPPYKTQNNRVQLNETTFEGDACAGGASDVKPDHENYSIIENGNNKFDRNLYRMPRQHSKQVFVWGSTETDWAGAQKLGFEPQGQLILY
jgi:parallel beta-helix repeat protein